MGNICKKPEPGKAIMCGLYDSGKTTLLHKWKLDEVITSIPTIGFNVEEIQLSRKATVIAWDVGGRDKVRPLYRHFYATYSDVIVWVLDSSDTDPVWNRFEQARDELHRLLKEDELEGTPILLLCNKQDLPNAMSPEEAANRLGVLDIRDRNFIVVGVSATTGQGLDDARMALENLLLAAKDEKPRKSNKFQRSPSMAPARPEYGATKTEGNQTLQQFAAIQNNTECPFAKAAKLWGGSPATKESRSSLKDQAKANCAALVRFVYECKQNNAVLDGFCLEVDHPSARDGGPREFGECVHSLLTAISDLDPEKEFVMRVKYIGNRGWRFRFGGIDFFVTSFAPCYPKTSSRYAFGAKHAFLLLQPELSFARHSLPPDTAETNYDEPKMIRDKTRAAYKAAGRAYTIPATTKYPPAEHIVKPIHDDGVTVVRWWEGKSVLERAQ